MKNLTFFQILLFIVPVVFLSGQSNKSIKAVKFRQPPVIDGNVEEDVWQQAEAVEGFIQFEPENGQPSLLRTIARVGYGDEALYVAFTCYDPELEGIAAAVIKRDGDLKDDDAVFIMLDTFNDNSTSSYFITNSLGTQADGKIADNGRSHDEKWDATWFSAAARIPDGWTAEFAIPLRILKYHSGDNQTWGLNLGRYYPRRLEVSLWSGPVEHERRVSQFGDLNGLDLQAQVKRYEIIPYALSQVEQGNATEGKAGLDVRYRLSNNLSADLTVNPDFATIEADVEKINLTRFELSISEKRPFFLEGAEMFRQRIRQFYSRRIGDIPWGSKLTGKIQSWDLSVLNTQSQSINSNLEGPGANYTVLRGKKGLFGSSNIGFLAANRAHDSSNQGSLGLDATLFFSETLGATAQFTRAHGPNHDGSTAWFIRPAFDNSTSHFHVRYSHWGENLMENMNAVGFVRDDNRKEFDSNLSHKFWMKGEAIDKISTMMNYNHYWSQDGILRSWNLSTRLNVELSNMWDIGLSQKEEFKRYEKDFRNRETQLALGYDNRAGRSTDISYSFGRNYDRDMRLVRSGVGYKISDFWNMGYNLTKLWLKPDPGDENTWIHVLRSNYYVTKDFYLKLFFQSSSAIDKQNVQIVWVWRFLPPFGSVQVAYQRGTSRFGTSSDQGHTLFTKFSWVF
jgi:hypothetical protein